MQRMAAVAVVALVACGPSSAEIRTARTATYAGQPAEIFEAAWQATGATYPIGRVDREAFTLETVPRFYSPEGDLQSQGAGGFVHAEGGSVEVSFVVEVIETADRRFMVKVTPRTYQIVSWSPKPRELMPDDPYLPTFVTGRAESLALAIYERARRFAVAPPSAP